MMHNKKLVLVGFMGTGKSTVADLLGDKLQLKVVDVDAQIVETAKQSIPSIFEQYGEAYFRQLETKALKLLLEQPISSIVATGGGAVLKDENKALMLQHSLVVNLTATPDVIIERVKHDTNRPLLQGEVEKRVYDLLEKRKDSYSFAHITIDTTALSLEQVADTICGYWNTQHYVAGQ